MVAGLKHRLLSLVLGLGLAAMISSGCYVSPRTAHTVGHVAAAALWTAAIAGQLAMLSYHDGHYHHEHCGHYRRWHQGRWVYYYGGHWEFYDPDAGAWYYYAE
jgi:tellurite resistance protein TehA-like permease